MDQKQYKEAVGKRLKQFASYHFGSLRKMAETMGVSPANLTPYTQGRYLPGNVMVRRLRKIGCDIDWLLDRQPATIDSSRRTTPRRGKKGEFRNLQLMNVKVFGMEPAKGVIPIFSNYNIQSGNIAEDSVVEYINYDKLTPAGTFGVTLRDDSLAGRGLHEGDRVLVNPMAQPHDSAIVVVNIDDEVFIKIYRKQNKQVSFETTDTAVEPLVMTSDDSYEVIGVAVQKIALL